MESLETSFHRCGSHCYPRPHQALYALEFFPTVLRFEQVAHELAGTFRNHDAVRLRNPCKRAARFGVSPTMLLLGSARADQVSDDHDPVAMPTRVCSGAWVFRAPTEAINSSPHAPPVLRHPHGLGVAEID